MASNIGRGWEILVAMKRAKLWDTGYSGSPIMFRGICLRRTSGSSCGSQASSPAASEVMNAFVHIVGLRSYFDNINCLYRCKIDPRIMAPPIPAPIRSANGQPALAIPFLDHQPCRPVPFLCPLLSIFLENGHIHCFCSFLLAWLCRSPYVRLFSRPSSYHPADSRSTVTTTLQDQYLESSNATSLQSQYGSIDRGY